MQRQHGPPEILKDALKKNLRWFISWYSVFPIFILMISGCGNQPRKNMGIAAKDALSVFRIADDFKIEMIASEPLVSDPGRE